MTVIDKLLILLIDFITMILSILLIGLYSGILDIKFLIANFENYQKYTVGIEGIVVGAVLFLISIRILQLFFRKKKVKQAIVARNEFGDVNISLDAINSLVHDIVKEESNAKDIQSKIKVKEDGVHVYLNFVVDSRTIIPELSERLQEILKARVSESTGVKISKVQILIKEIKREERARLD
ncbi:cell envelope-related Asp23 family protein [Orenia metallireducens]|jgi:uncharacterized alkaline shock family protein YloU|uniref:Asp23 family, cell envelope-related function n=1 Tax=Orenia metallireducens TaxID=1413210 RepID=A0A285HLG0_9FIRM|nr:alkaline shock response membrane anchor protein AmaP [Orenia metallireducens]PRX26910.1 cell envelope-related Asp23 family protein [Orenia metallireducens]SNY36555.1 Asp23 family, cell envelope-related function [Orenia metallireducens]